MEWKPTAFRLRGRPNMKQKDEVNQDLKVIKMHRWEKQAESRNDWKWIIEQVQTHKELQCKQKKKKKNCK